MFDGGGYMNDSFAEEPQKLTSTVSIGGEEKSKSIAAVSVAQITKLYRPLEGLIIHGKKIYHCNLVAHVYEIVDMSSMKIQVLVDDYTAGGPLEVNHIMADSGVPENDLFGAISHDQEDTGSSKPSRPITSLKVGDYIRAIGVVKFSNDKANFNAYNLKIIEDPNVITAHILEVIRDSMYYERLQKQSGNPLPFAEDQKSNIPMHQQPRDEFGKLSTRDKHILKFLKEKATSDSGVHVDQICSNLKAFPRDEVVASLNLLSNEGLCWVGDEENMWCVNTAD